MAPTNNLEQEAVAWVEAHGGGTPSTVQELLDSPKWPQVEAAIQEGMERANSRAVSNVAKIKRWAVIPREFSVEGGELSPSLKMKRFYVAEMYKDTISSMYTE